MRLVAQHTAQIWSPRAGHARLTGRFLQIGQVIALDNVCNSRAYRVRVATVWPRMIPFRGLRVSPNSDRESKNPNRLGGV